MAGLIIKVTLENTHPPVWRRIVIPENFHFGQLHQVLQTAFGWYDCHLHEFSSPGNDFIIGHNLEDFNWGQGVQNEKDFQVRNVLKQYPWMRYTYDFGDDWRHKILLEKEDPSYEKNYATVLKAKGDGFEEDSGGVWAYSGQMDEEDGYVPDRVPFSIEDVNYLLEKRLFYRLGVTAGLYDEPDDEGREDSLFEEESYDEDLEDSLFEEESDDEDSDEYDFDEDDFFDDGFPFIDDFDEDSIFENDLKMMEILSSIGKSTLKTNLMTLHVFLHRPDFWKKTQIISPQHPDEENGGDEDLNQHILPFLTREEVASANKKKSKRNGKPWVLELTVCPDSIEMIASRFPMELLNVYSDVFGITNQAVSSQSSIASLYAAYLKQHPAYLFYWLTEETGNDIHQLSQGYLPTDDINALERALLIAITMGLAEVKIEETSKKTHLTIRWSEEAAALINSIGEKEEKRICAEREALRNFIAVHMEIYGIVEVDELFRMYKSWDNGKARVDEKELRNIFLWQFEGLDAYRFYYDKSTGKDYIYIRRFDPGKALKMRKELPEGWKYKTYSKAELSPENHFFFQKNVSWSFFVDGILSDPFPDEISRGIAALFIYEDLLFGGPIDVIRNNVEEWIGFDDPDSFVSWWQCLIDLWMSVPQMALKGYSREEYRKITGNLPTWLPYSDRPLKKRGGNKTHLVDMPFQVQDKLYRFWRQTDPGPADQEIETLLQTYRDNVEVQLWETHRLEHTKHYEEAEEKYRELFANHEELREFSEELFMGLKMQALFALVKEPVGSKKTEPERTYLERHSITDKERKSILEQIGEEEREMFGIIIDQFQKKPSISIVPFRGEAKKIGRNDPCPCGSGKKYKNCCGR